MTQDLNANQGRNRPATTSEKRIGIAFCIALAVVLVAVGCSAINPHRAPPADWPKLAVTVEKVGFWELQKVCGGNLLVQYFGCAWIYFHDMTCRVYYAADDESAAAVIEHELMHCEGFDHIGSSALADGWTNWKREKMK